MNRRTVSPGALIFVLVLLAAAVGIGVWVGPWVRAAMQNKSDAEMASSSEEGTYYTCGMHPWVVLPEPGDCPICQMELVPIDPAKFTGQIAIDPVVVQNIGVRIKPVAEGPLVKTIRTVGTVDYNETAVRDINIKVNGWIEKLNVDYLGAEVKAGDPLFSLYSPELYSAQEEYLLAWRNKDKVGAQFVPDAAKNAESLLKSARTKLEYFDITDQQVQQLQQSGQPAKTMTLRSPYSGVVIDKHANEGMKVDPGMRVFRIADLSKVWVMVTLYEYQLPYVQVGQEAVMSLPYIPGQTFTGRVIYIYPYIDNKTRQVKVRLEFDNPTGLLKPGMFTNIELRNELAAERTLAPRSAVIDTGQRQIAFVSLGEGKFEPRDVKLGVETEDGHVEVLDGLKPGEMVVTSGQFLLDSEAKMRESLAKMIKGNLAADQKVVAKVEGASELNELPDALADQLNTLLHAYLTISESLFNDHLEGVDASAKTIAQAADAMTQVAIPDHPHFWHQHEEVATVGGKATDLAAAKNLKSARSLFADLSLALGDLLKATGVPPSFDMPIQQLHCPMYRTDQGGNLWLQTGEQVHNPFYGVNSPMPGCFDKRTVLPVTGQHNTAPDQPEGHAQPHDAPKHDASMHDVSKDAPDSADHPSVAKGRQVMVDELFTNYLATQIQLATDQMPYVADNLARIRQIAKHLDDPERTEWQSVAQAIPDEIKDINQAREAFRKVSPLLVSLAEKHPPSKAIVEQLYVAKCPMKKGGVWLQPTDSVTNPYYGNMMLDCGSIQKPIESVPAPADSYYTCKKHPWIITAEAEKCPIGGEQLIPLSRARMVDQMLELLQADDDQDAPAPTTGAKE
ncbi:efflux RND transporter periplasmic adaptor subunit [Planctomycetales bacterium ZRK34]|nr:efflux RND transporter periplasmic adaptor subunit [Planctomycetales bacterium ZRK34]